MKHFATVMLGFGIVLAALPPARAADTTCPPTPSPGSTVNGNLIVRTGQGCELAGVTVTGNVQVQPNTYLNMYLGLSAGGSIIASKIEGNLTLGSGTYVNFGGNGDPAGTERIGGNVTADHCGFLRLGSGTEFHYPNPAVIVGGNVLIEYCQSDLVEVDNTEIGGNLTCNSNSQGCSLTFSNIKGNVQSNNNESEILGNTVGGNVEINNNGIATVVDNTIGGNLQCQGNPSIRGEGNMVGGHKTGECTNF